VTFVFKLLSAAEKENGNMSPMVFWISSLLGSKNLAERNLKKEIEKIILFFSLLCFDRQTEEP
jgi:hypothetical protein